MAEPTLRDVLDQLTTQRDRLAVLHDTVRAQGTELAHYRRRQQRGRIARRFLPLTLVALLVALLPLSILAAGFNDLNANSVHNTNIQLIADAGITKGCDPGVSYCPNGLVTREEMASFLARTAGLGDNPPVVNAKNAATVGGLAPNGLLRVARSQRTSAYLALNRDGIPVNSVTITPPGTGFVLITATVAFYIDPNGGRVNYVTAMVRDTGASGAAAFSPPLYLSLANRTGYAYTDTGTITWAFPVSGTTPRVFQLIASQSFNPDGATYNQVYLTGDSGNGGAMTALFVPFAQDGGTTLAP